MTGFERCTQSLAQKGAAAPATNGGPVHARSRRAWRGQRRPCVGGTPRFGQCDELQAEGMAMNKPPGTTRVQRCARCGNEFAYVYTRGRPRKWCSRRCGGAQHPHVCAVCGSLTVRRTAKKPGAPELCRRCASRRFGQRLEELWARGLTAREIAAEVGWRTADPNALISIWRAKGYDLPYRHPEMVVVGRRLAARARRHSEVL